MNDKTGFSLSMSVDPTNAFKPLPDKVVFDLCRAYPVPAGNLLLHNTRNGKRAMVKPEVFSSLLLCNRFKTFEEHAETIIARNPGMQGQQTDICKVLKNMLDSGIMLSAKHISDSFKSKTDKGNDAREETAPVVAILTWERPQALERLLESIARNCDTEKFHRLYVIDDSRNAENIGRNQALTEQFISKISSPIQYFGRVEQQSLINQLVKQLPEHENAIHFLTDASRWEEHWTTGLTRNLALLLSCGRHLVMIDDDAICEVHNPPQQKPDITVSDDPREVAFFGDEQEWAHLQQPINPDPVNRHMQCLGLSFSEALAVLGQNHLKAASFTNATALQLSELQPDSAVLVTECGSLGCPGTNNYTWLPDMAPVSLKQMLASSKKTSQALEDRKVWSGRSHPHFAPRSNMSQISGFDNCELLPPYLPILRGQDRLFGNMLDFVYPQSLVLDLPWAVPHKPIPERKWRDRDLNFEPPDSFPKFFVDKIVEHKSSCSSTSPVDRLNALATWFKDLATADADSLTAMYRDNRLNHSSGLLQKLTDHLATSDGAPVNWQNYLRNGISQLNIDLDKVSREDFEVKGLPASLEKEALITFWRTVWRDFSSALKAWPEIRDAAQKAVNS